MAIDCTRGSAITQIRYIGRTSEGSHRFSVSWRLASFPDAIMRCNSGSDYTLTFTVRFVGGRVRRVRLEPRVRNPGTAIFNIPGIGDADPGEVTATLETITRVRQNATRTQRV